MDDIKERVRASLATVMDPELGVGILEAGMVPNIEIAESVVTIQLALTTIACPLRSRIQGEVRQKISDLYPAMTVEFQVVEMDSNAKAELMRLARSKASSLAGRNSIPAHARVIAVSSGKGGVGKSTITASLAVALAEEGFVVGILDADIWGFSIPKMLDVNQSISAKGSSTDWEIDPVSMKIGKGELRIISMGFLSRDPTSAIMWRGLVLNRAFQHFIEDVDWSGIDYLLIDMPPGTGDIQMGLSRMLSRAEVIIVTTPNDTATEVALRMVDMANKGNLTVLGVVENMSYFECGHGERYEIFGSGTTQEICEQTGLEVLARIPIANRQHDSNLSIKDRFAEAVSTPDVVEIRKFADKFSKEIAPPIAMEGCTSRISALFDNLNKTLGANRQSSAS